MTRPLSDPLPLRDTTVWPGYDAIAIIPRVYGRTRIKPLRYTEAGTLYVVADHAITGVDAVTLDGAPIDYRWRNGADVTGHAVAFLELARAPDTQSTLIADVRGLSGNPADILADIDPRQNLQDFGIYCRNQNLVLGGALDKKMTHRAAIQFVLDQVGAVWSAGLPGFAQPFPPPVDGPLWATLDALDIADWTAQCELSVLVTRLSVPFDDDAAAGKARQSVVLEAPAASQIHGVRTAELALPWVRSARQAIATATAYLQWRARPLWTVQLQVGPRWRHLQPGGWIHLNHPRLPHPGEYVITDLDPGYGSGTVTLTAQAAAGPVPVVSLLSQASAFAPIQTEYRMAMGGDTVILTITNEAGEKLPGAKVWIDDQGPLTTNANAEVQFQPTPGAHVVRVEIDGRTVTTTTLSL